MASAKAWSYAGSWVTRDQAAFFAGVWMTSTPFLNVTPRMILGNWFSPFSLCRVLADA
jgi:hypothetical protein